MSSTVRRLSERQHQTMETALMPRASLRSVLAASAAIALAVALSGCAQLGASGPSSRSINRAQINDPRIRVVDLDEPVTRSVVAASSSEAFAKVFGDVPQRNGLIAPGDVLDISVWEAPPAVLFTSGRAIAPGVGMPTYASGSDFPGQMVDADGTITVPFAGRVKAIGRAPAEVAREIAARLSTKAHDPQAMVRISQNQGSDVTVVGDVATSRRIPLTTRNERLLDALAGAGGVRQPVDKVLIQITRGKTSAARPLGTIIRDPGENITLAPNDIVTALYQPYSFQALGALGANAEVPIEGSGITLAQAIARVGGLQDQRANIKGVFIFRFETPEALTPELRSGAPLTPEGRIPVIYRIDMSDPATFFVMQSFPMRDKDILYVSNAPAVDFQKFVGLVSQLTFSVVGIVSNVP
jgi:polysaccharide biosynthesis/export protein